MVEFARDETLGARGENVRDRTVAWTNFQYGPLADVTEGVSDTVAGLIVYEKVLAQLGLAEGLHSLFRIRGSVGPLGEQKLKIAERRCHRFERSDEKKISRCAAVSAEFESLKC